MVGRRRRPAGAARPKPGRVAEEEWSAAANGAAGGARGGEGRGEIAFDDPMRSVYMLAVLYSVTLEAAQTRCSFACAPGPGEPSAETNGRRGARE